MKIVPSCRLSLATVSVAVVLSACGAGSNGYPTVEDVKVWHTKTASNGYFKLRTVEIADLNCTTPSKNETEQLTRAAAFMGSKAEEAIKGAVKCSYTVNASFNGVDGPFLKTEGYEVNGLKLANQGFMRVPQGDGYEWQGSTRRLSRTAR
jgi:hypothetical protein